MNDEITKAPKKKKDKNMNRYFGNNLATVFYVLSFAMMAIGLVGVFLGYFYFYAGCLALIGVVLFFITVRMKITDKDYDEVMSRSVSQYKEKYLEDKMINRKKVEPETVDLFYGYLFDQAGLKRKLGKDGKMRSSRYYITAVRVNRTGFLISYSEYDTLTGDESHQFIYAEPENDVSLERPREKPALGDSRYVIHIGGEKEETVLVFHLPDDALADEKLKAIEDLKKEQTKQE